ncbi:MAG TPA: hypothetical protein VHB77_12025 [Planctomycetaceae bacterium]|nr:hypothetical protein [Planctomycetaceae bacterium]
MSKSFPLASPAGDRPRPAYDLSPPELSVLRRRWEAALMVLFLAWMFLVCCFPLTDTDFWWHLRTGELIVERGWVPQHDWFTYTDADRPWIDLHWGFQLIVTALYHLGGVNLIIVFKSAVLAAAAAIACLSAGRTLPAWQRYLIWLGPLIAISGRGYERPEILSLLFMAAWFWILSRSEERPKLLWLLPVVQVMWTNCHSLFVLGLAIGGCWAIDRTLRQAWGGRFGLEPVARSVPLWQVWTVLAVSAAASFINPYFEQGAFFPLVVYRKFSVEQDFYSVRIGEFQRPVKFLWDYGLRNIYLDIELLVACVAALSFVVLAWRRALWSPGRLLLFAAFGHLAWEASRNTSIFALVAGVVTCANFAAAARARSERDFEPILLTQLAILSALALIVAVVTGVWNDIGGERKPFGFGERPAWFMHGPSRFAGTAGMPEHALVFHNGQAPVYIYHNGPQRTVFMDARLEVSTRQTFEKYEEIQRLMAKGDRRWGEIARAPDGKLPAVLLDSRNSLALANGLLQQPEWRLVYADPTGGVFIETRLAQELNLPAVDPIRMSSPEASEMMRMLRQP